MTAPPPAETVVSGTAGSEASPGDAGDGNADKIDFINSYFAWLASNPDNVKMSVWFDQDVGSDWAVFGGTYGNGDDTASGGSYPNGCQAQRPLPAPPSPSPPANGGKYCTYPSYRDQMQASWLLPNGPTSATTPYSLLSESQFTGGAF